MEQLTAILAQHPYEWYALWMVRLGSLLVLLGLILPGKEKRKRLSKIFKRRDPVHAQQETSRWVRFADAVAEKPLFKHFRLDEESDDYQKLEKEIVKAGGAKGLNPNIIQVYRILLPPFAFVAMLFLYIYRATRRSISLTESQITERMESVAGSDGFVQTDAVLSFEQSAGASGISPVPIVWIFVFSLLVYFLPNLLLKLQIRNRKALMRKEMPVIQTFVVIMLESGTHTVYEILKTLTSTTTFFKPYLSMCLNEYYVDPKRAIQNMADRVQDEEFQVVCNSLKQAVEEDKQYTASFMKQHIDQIQKLSDLKREASIKKKPMLYVFLLAMPMIALVIIWFYPWFIRAVDMLTTGF